MASGENAIKKMNNTFQLCQCRVYRRQTFQNRIPQQQEVVFEDALFVFGEQLVNAQKDIDADIKQLIYDHFLELFK